MLGGACGTLDSDEVQANGSDSGRGRAGVRHLRRDVLGAQLGLHVGVVELADEGVRPGLAGVDRYVHVVLPVPLPPLLRRHSLHA